MIKIVPRSSLGGGFRALLSLILVSFVLVGCGNDRDQFVATNTGNVSPLGSLTFNFVSPQQAFTAPQSTTKLRFELFAGSKATGELLDTITKDFQATVVLTNVSTSVQSVRITYFDANGIPVAQSVTNVEVRSGLNTVVDSTNSSSSVPTFQALNATEVLPVSVGSTGQIVVSAVFSSGDTVILTGNTKVGITYTPANSAIATVANTGIVTGVSVGNANVAVQLNANGTTLSGATLVEVRAVTTFETSQEFTTGSVGGQNGWRGNANMDQEIVPVDDFRTESAFDTFGQQALRISSTIGGVIFDDAVYAAPLPDSVGESQAIAVAPFQIGTRYNHFDVEFDFGTTTTTQQPDLKVSVAPTTGEESRMSFLRFEDRAGGVAIVFADYNTTDSFVSTDIATGLSRAVPHHVKLSFTAVEGTSNDVVQVYVDSQLAHTGTSWEDYYWFDAEPNPNLPRVVKTVLFQVRDAAAAGTGFLFDNISMAAYDVAVEN